MVRMTAVMRMAENDKDDKHAQGVHAKASLPWHPHCITTCRLVTYYQALSYAITVPLPLSDGWSPLATLSCRCDSERVSAYATRIMTPQYMHTRQ
eukprot:m.186280 g.186280  ORF g.186280 m.186280 type:complete len:95 (-) comp16919_c0_seq17:67-351(-)